jgi:hypothetical protein
MAERLKGQETILRFIKDGAVQEELVDIQSFEVDDDMALLSEGYVGETTQRKDDIFNGCSGSCSLHVENATYVNFFGAIVNRARRKTPMFKVDAITVFSFPDGNSSKKLYADIRFGPIKTSVGSREGYVSVSFDFGCSEGETIS